MTRTSEQIKMDIVDQLYWDARVDASKIEVHVSHGEVTLSGTVPDFESLQAAENDTWMIPGVFSGNHRLSISATRVAPLFGLARCQVNLR